MVEKTTLATASLQRPQLLIHIGEAYRNWCQKIKCYQQLYVLCNNENSIEDGKFNLPVSKWQKNCAERITPLSWEKSATTTRAWTADACRRSLSSHNGIWREAPLWQDCSNRLGCCHWWCYLIHWWVFGWNIFWGRWRWSQSGNRETERIGSNWHVR
jgi:hypothetical protein